MGDDGRLELLDPLWCEQVVDVDFPCLFPFIVVREESNNLLSELVAEEESGLGGGRAARERLVMRVEEHARARDGLDTTIMGVDASRRRKMGPYFLARPARYRCLVSPAFMRCGMLPTTGNAKGPGGASLLLLLHSCPTHNAATTKEAMQMYTKNNNNVSIIIPSLSHTH